MSRELLQQALEVMEEATTYTSSPAWSPSMTEECNKVIAALRAALAQPAPAVPDMQPLPNHDNHHNALLCPYCNPRKLKFAEPDAAPAVPAVPVSWERLRTLMDGIPTREEFIGGQRQKYVAKEEVMGWLYECQLRSEREAVPAVREPLTVRELELIDGMIDVQLHHAAQCDSIANRTMAEKQKGWDMERVELLRKLRGITGDNK